MGLSLCVLYLKVLTWPWSYCRRMLGEVGGERGERRGPVSDIDFYSRDRREQGRSGVEVHHQSEGMPNGENVKVS